MNEEQQKMSNCLWFSFTFQQVSVLELFIFLISNFLDQHSLS